MTVVVHAHHERIALRPRQSGDLIRERREPTNVFAQLFAVEINIRLVIRRREVEEQPVIRRGFGHVELRAVPDRTFVEKQPLILCVPVARHIQGRAGVKIVLHQVALAPGWLIQKKPATWLLGLVIGLAAIIKITRVIGIHDVMPPAVQAGGLARKNIAEHDVAAHPGHDRQQRKQ